MTEYFTTQEQDPKLFDAFEKVSKTKSKQPMKILSAVSDFVMANPALLVILFLGPIMISFFLVMNSDATVPLGYSIMGGSILFLVMLLIGSSPYVKNQKLLQQLDETLKPDYENLTEWFKNSYSLIPIAGYYYGGIFQESRDQGGENSLLMDFLRAAVMTPGYTTSPVIHFVTKDGASFNGKLKKNENGWLLEKTEVSSPEENVTVPQTV